MTDWRSTPPPPLVLRTFNLDPSPCHRNHPPTLIYTLIYTTLISTFPSSHSFVMTDTVRSQMMFQNRIWFVVVVVVVVVISPRHRSQESQIRRRYQGEDTLVIVA